MKRKMLPRLLALALVATLVPSALAAAPPSTCYPTSVTRSEDGTQIRKVYDLGPDEDPAGIPRSDFDQEGYHYTLNDLLKQESPEHEERFHTETVTLNSKSKDMESVLSLLPAQREFTTDDGLTGTLSLKLDTVQVDVAGYGSSTRAVSATRTYPNLSGQDTSYIPKEITDNGRTLTLSTINWQTDGYSGDEGYSDHYTAIATYTGSATSSYVTGYVVTADYSGTVSRIALNKVRYVAIFEGTPLYPIELEPELDFDPEPETTPDTAKPDAPAIQFNWAYVLVPVGVIAAAGAGIGVMLFIKERRENSDDAEGEDEGNG